MSPHSPSGAVPTGLSLLLRKSSLTSSLQVTGIPPLSFPGLCSKKALALLPPSCVTQEKSLTFSEMKCLGLFSSISYGYMVCNQMRQHAKGWHIAVTDPVMLVTLDTDLAYGGGTGWGNKWGMGGETVTHSDK